MGLLDASGLNPLLPSTASATGTATADPMSGSGYTSDTPASGSSTTWASSKLTCAVPEGVTAQNAAGVTLATLLPESDAYDLMIRYDFVAGSGDNAIVYVGVGRSLTHYWIAAVSGSGRVSAGRVVAGTYTGEINTAADTVSAGERTGAQGWLRVRRTPVGIAVMTGAGSAGAVPTEWTTHYAGPGSSADAMTVSQGRWGKVGANTYGSITGGLTVDVLAIRTAAQSASGL